MLNTLSYFVGHNYRAARIPVLDLPTDHHMAFRVLGCDSKPDSDYLFWQCADFDSVANVAQRRISLGGPRFMKILSRARVGYCNFNGKPAKAESSLCFRDYVAFRIYILKFSGNAGLEGRVGVIKMNLAEYFDLERLTGRKKPHIACGIGKQGIEVHYIPNYFFKLVKPKQPKLTAEETSEIQRRANEIDLKKVFYCPSQKAIYELLDRHFFDNQERTALYSFNPSYRPNSHSKSVR